MKSVHIFVTVCVLALAQVTYGGFVGDLVDFGKDVRQKIDQDIHRLLHRDNQKNKDPVAEYVTKPNQPTNQPTKEDPSFTTSTAAAVIFRDNLKPTEVSKVNTPVTPGNATVKSDPKDGKENFKGGCQTGFMKTEDGRCMPTY